MSVCFLLFRIYYGERDGLAAEHVRLHDCQRYFQRFPGLFTRADQFGSFFERFDQFVNCAQLMRVETG